MDDGISGTTFDRPSFKNLINDITYKKINMVITKDLSRLGRDYILTGYYLEKFFPENKVRYIALLDGIDTESSDSSNDITPFRAVFNDMYAKDISNKIKSVKHNKQTLGLFIGGKAPFGYKLDKKIPNKLFIDEEAKPIILRIFHDATIGMSCRCIAKNLDMDKIPTPSQYAISKGLKVAKQSTHWSDSRIREILLNEVYIGNMVQGRMKKVNYKSKKNIRLPNKEWKVVKNTHEPIIDNNTFQRANEMIILRKQTRVKSHDYLLKGLVHCHECGKKMNCSSRHLASGTRYYFRCLTHISQGKYGLCSPHSMRMDHVENLILNTLNTLVNKYYNPQELESIAEQYFSKQIEEYNYNDKIAYYNNKISELTVQIDKLYDDRLSGMLCDDDFKRIYETKTNSLRQQKNELIKLNTILTASHKENIMKNLSNNFKSKFKVDREILTNFIDKIEIDKSKRIYVYFKFKSIQ